MDSANDPEPSRRGRRSKVKQAIEKYDLTGVGAELEHRWTAETDRYSLRELAAYFNRLVLQSRLEDANVQLLEGDVENIYRLLTTDDVSSAERTRVRRHLEREGIDVEALESDFVTYQAIRTYLNKYRDAEYTQDETEPRKRETENIQRLRGRTTAVTDGKIEQLRDGGHLEIDEFRTLVNIQIVCEQCNTQYDVLELLDHGGCDCFEE